LKLGHAARKQLAALIAGATSLKGDFFRSVAFRCRGYSASQELAAIWIEKGIESVVFPSATGTGRNVVVVVYLANAKADCVIVRNRDEVLAALRGDALISCVA
jgi:hypothetical protein